MEKYLPIIEIPESIDAKSEEDARQKMHDVINKMRFSNISTNGKVTTKMYLHGSKETNSEIGEELGLSDTALEAFVYALYEVELDVEVDIVTGNCKIIAVDGRKVS